MTDKIVSPAESWAKLVRFPAVFTVIAQVAAAFLLVAGTAEPIARLIVITAAAVSLYWFGMIGNDLCDLEEDRRERPTRPLASEEISVRAARAAAWGLMILGVALATASGLIPSKSAPTTYGPAIVAIAIAVCVGLYNGLLKKTLMAPMLMGICRALCFLLGAAPLVMVNAANMVDPIHWFAPHVLAVAIGMGVYIMGITLISTTETTGGQKSPIAFGTAIALLGSICMAMAPSFAPEGTAWKISLEGRFPLLIGLIAFSVLFRGIRAAIRPEIKAIQNLVRIGVMTLIPFSAAFAAIAAGPGWGLAVFALIIPAIATAARIRVT
jgi:4-hydroxybenzoate polyprenyltransferase